MKQTETSPEKTISPVLVLLSLLFCSASAIGRQPAVTRVSGARTKIGTRVATSVTDAITQSDCGTLISYSNPSAISVILPAATSLLSGCWVDVQNSGAGAVTITPTTSMIDGASSIVLATNQGVRIVDATNQYLTQRGQGQGSGGGPTYSADGATLNLIATTFSANTAVMASRVTAAQGIDTTCAVVSGSSSAYVGAMRGNAYVAGYADGMRVLAEVDTTTGGGAITLDCGSGAKPVYQNDGASNPTTAQWASATQVLVTYGGNLNSGAGGRRILSGSSGGGVTIPSTSNLLKGNGSGAVIDSTIAPANVATLSGTNVYTSTNTFVNGANIGDTTNVGYECQNFNTYGLPLNNANLSVCGYYNGGTPLLAINGSSGVVVYNQGVLARPVARFGMGWADDTSTLQGLVISGSTNGSFGITGCSVSANSGGAIAGQFTSGTTGTCTVTITPHTTLAHTPNGFSCWANDLTTPSDVIHQTGGSTTTAILSGTTVTGDVVNFGCLGY